MAKALCGLALCYYNNTFINMLKASSIQLKLYSDKPMDETTKMKQELQIKPLPKLGSKFKIETMNESGDIQQLQYVMKQTFFYDEPTIKLFNLNGNENNGELLNVMLEGISWNESFMAKNVETNAMVGFALNGEYNQAKLQSDLTRWTTKVKEPRNKKLLSLWNSLSEQFDYKNVCPVGRAIEIYYLGVAPEARRQGLAKALVNQSVKLAKKNKYGLVQVVCTSDRSAKICASMGMTKACEVDYGVLLMPTDGRPVVTVPPPAPDSQIKIYYQLL